MSKSVPSVAKIASRRCAIFSRFASGFDLSPDRCRKRRREAVSSNISQSSVISTRFGIDRLALSACRSVLAGMPRPRNAASRLGASIFVQIISRQEKTRKQGGSNGHQVSWHPIWPSRGDDQIVWFQKRRTFLTSFLG